MIYFYSDFLRKLIRAGRGDGTLPTFRLGVEIDREDFIRFANKFIEDYYATVSPEFAFSHPMKFCFGSINEDDRLHMVRNISSKNVENHPGINAGIIYLEMKKDGNEDETTLHASIYRQACFIRRERWKFLLAVIGSFVAIAAFFTSLAIRK